MPRPGSRDPRTCINRFIAYAIPYEWMLAPEKIREGGGIDLIISDVVRIPPESVDPTVKNYHWGDLVSALLQAYDRGSQNAVLVDFEGNVHRRTGVQRVSR